MSATPTRFTLYTQRLALRPFRLQDGPRVQQLAGERQVAEMTGNIPYPYPDGAAGDWIRHHDGEWKRGEIFTFAIARREDDDCIGAISLSVTPYDWRAELGYWLGIPYWNQGYMTEAAYAVLQFAFETLKLNRVYARHYPRNPASGRVMQKIGMTREGTLRQHVVHWNRAEDLVYYGILADEWKKFQEEKAQ